MVQGVLGVVFPAELQELIWAVVIASFVTPLKGGRKSTGTREIEGAMALRGMHQDLGGWHLSRDGQPMRGHCTTCLGVQGISSSMAQWLFSRERGLPGVGDALGVKVHAR